MSFEVQVLVLGAESTGKTLLLKRLQNVLQDGYKEEEEFEVIPPTVPTIGTNLANIVFNKRKLNFRELGGAMAPIWKNFYGESNAVMYLIDASNNFQISASTILFFDVLKAEKLSKTPILLLFNKTDLASNLSIQELKLILRLTDLQKHVTQKLTVIECSLKTGIGIKDLKDWLLTI